MTERTFRISGQVLDRKSGRGIAGIQVEAWDKDLIYDDLVGSATTDEQGAFQMMFETPYFQEIFVDRRPDLFFKVFYEGKLIHSTEENVLWNIDIGDTSVEIEVDAPPLEGEHKMKMQILRDRKGEIIAIFEQRPGALVSIEPEPEDGDELAEIEVPDEYLMMPSADLINRLQADIQAKRIEMKPKKQ